MRVRDLIWASLVVGACGPVGEGGREGAEAQLPPVAVIETPAPKAEDWNGRWAWSAAFPSLAGDVVHTIDYELRLFTDSTGELDGDGFQTWDRYKLKVDRTPESAVVRYAGFREGMQPRFADGAVLFTIRRDAAGNFTTEWGELDPGMPGDFQPVK